MVFNWFRRQFNAPSEQPQVENEETLEQPQVESTESTQTPESSSPEVSVDYLNWAKAAYQNIQKQQAPLAAESTDLVTPTESEESEAETTSESTTPEIADEPVETLPVVSSELEPVTEPELEQQAPVVENIEPVAATDAIPAPQTELQTQTETTTAAETVDAVESEATSDQAIPLWARESTERQARLERLKATAIEEAEPVTAQAQSQAVPDLAFDENFVWSAEVLARQGRRPEDVSAEEINWLQKLRLGLDKTRRSLINQLKAIVGQGPLNQDAVEEIEALLLQADVGVEATDYIIKTLQQKLREEALPPEQAIAYLKEILRSILDRPFQDTYTPTFTPEKDTLNIWLMTGVNGAGKTTTIGKIAHLAQKSGYQCLIGAADTFRAAAVEQVKVWGQRSGIEVIANPGKNTDPAAVVFDAIAAAKARGTELLLVDTAGRLQNKKNLMEELSKIRRIIDKKAPDAKVESLLVLDATLGQNGLRQAQVFSEAAKLSGVVLTKLDGTAKGGVAIAVVQQLGLPIRFIGAGEGIEDLRPFSSYEFVEALLSG